MTASDETNTPTATTGDDGDGVRVWRESHLMLSPSPLTPEVVREIGYDIADHFLDGLLPHLIKANVLSRESDLGNHIGERLNTHVIEGSGGLTRDDMRAVARQEIRRAERAAMARLRSSAGPVREDVLGDLTDHELELPDDGDQTEQGGVVDDVQTVAPGGSLGERALEVLRASGFLRDPEEVVSEMLGRTHESSPSVSESGDPTVGDGGAAGDASGAPAAPQPTPDRESAVDRLVAEGFAVVELPEPAADKFGNPDFSNEHIRLTVYRDGCVQLETPEYFGLNAGIHPFQLRDLAQRCLAAATIVEVRRL